MANNILRPRIAGNANRLYPAGYISEAGEVFCEDLKTDIQAGDYSREYLKTEVNSGEYHYEYLKTEIRVSTGSLRDLKTEIRVSIGPVRDLKIEIQAGRGSLRDLKTEIQTRALLLDFVKVDIRAGIVSLEYLKTEIQAESSFLASLKVDIQAGAESLQELKCFVGVKYFYDTDYDFLKTDIRSKSQFAEELKTEIIIGNQLLITGLVIDVGANYGHDVDVGFLGWRPDPHDFEKNVPVIKRILFKLKDKMSGIDIDTVWVKVNGVKYRKNDIQFKWEGWRREYTISVRPAFDWEYGQEVNVEVYAEDLAGNPGLAVEIL